MAHFRVEHTRHPEDLKELRHLPSMMCQESYAAECRLHAPERYLKAFIDSQNLRADKFLLYRSHTIRRSHEGDREPGVYPLHLPIANLVQIL